MRLQKYIKISLLILVILLILFTPNSYAKEAIQSIESAPIEKSRLLSKTSFLNDKILLASTEFDLRDRINIVVKNQGDANYCWAFASTTTLETNLELTKNEVYDFSERHIAYSTARFFLDGLNAYGHSRDLNDGGNSSLAMAYYTSGRGPILEEEMPFSNSLSQIYLHEIENKTVKKKVADYVVFPPILKVKDEYGNIRYTNEEESINYEYEDVLNNRERIKSHIMNYGSVTAMTVSGNPYNQYYNYNLDYPAFYCEDISVGVNHQISIIGWDDNYPVENFNEAHRPSEPGAYLVLNSHGTDGLYKYGCYYISYEDAYIESGLVGVINVEDIDYDNIYQYDPLGISSSIYYEGLNSLYGANVFKKNKNIVEQLNEISIANFIEQDVEIYVNSKSGDLSFDELEKVETETNTIRQGYTTLKLKNPIELTGEEFAIVVKYINRGNVAHIGIENILEPYWLTANSKSGESYYSTDGENWIDFKDTNYNRANVCIKAFTTRCGYNITSDKYKVEEDIIYRIPPNTKVEDFLDNLDLAIDTQLKKDNKELTSDEFITTGTEFIIDNSKTFTLIVIGDIDEDGEVGLYDMVKVKHHLIGLDELPNNLMVIAADVDGSNEIDLFDVSKLKFHCIELEIIK